MLDKLHSKIMSTPPAKCKSSLTRRPNRIVLHQNIGNYSDISLFKAKMHSQPQNGKVHIKLPSHQTLEKPVYNLERLEREEILMTMTLRQGQRGHIMFISKSQTRQKILIQHSFPLALTLLSKGRREWKLIKILSIWGNTQDEVPEANQEGILKPTKEGSLQACHSCRDKEQ